MMRDEANNWRLHFIVGMSRAGITWLSRCLNSHPGITVFGQTRFWGKHYIEPKNGTAYSAEEIERLHIKLRAFHWDATIGTGPGCLRFVNLEGFRTLLDQVFADCIEPIRPEALFLRIALAISDREGKALVFEKTPHHINHLERIVQAYPYCRFVVLQCGPAHFIRVQKSQSDLLFHPVATALQWRRYMLACEEAANHHTDRIEVVHFEDLVARPKQALELLQRAFELQPQDLTADMPLCEESIGQSFGELPTPEDLFWMNRISGRIARRNGYDLGVSKTPILAILRTLVTMPTWIVQNLRVNKREVEGSLFDYYRNWLISNAGKRP